VLRALAPHEPGRERRAGDEERGEGGGEMGAGGCGAWVQGVWKVDGGCAKKAELASGDNPRAAVLLGGFVARKRERITPRSGARSS